MYRLQNLKQDVVNRSPQQRGKLKGWKERGRQIKNKRANNRKFEGWSLQQNEGNIIR